MQFFLSNRHYTLPYQVYGTGKHALLAFHGFGRTGEDFSVFEQHLGRDFTIYAFDLPYHGKGLVTSGPKNPVFLKHDLYDLIHRFLEQHKLQTFSVVGYSLGGKMALGCLEVFKEKVINTYLIAPDGLKINPFHFFGTRTLTGRLLFEYITDHPALLFKTGSLLEKLGMINPKIVHFTRHHMDTKEKRKKVFHVWMLFRKFYPDLQRIAQVINKNNTGLMLFFGNFDSVIPPSLAKKLIHRLLQRNVVHILHHGHKLLEKNKEISDIIIKNLNST